MVASAAGTESAVTLAPGAIVGAKYELEASLGEGGIRNVLLARHLALGHQDAINFLPQTAPPLQPVSR